MTVLDAIKAANAEGDYPTSNDLAEGLALQIADVRPMLSYWHRCGKIREVARVASTKRGARLKRWEAT